LNPAGTVAVRGEYWNALASSPIAAHEHVRVTGIDGLTLKVEAEKEA
jgi:membrane-bound ClpP family serine protease